MTTPLARDEMESHMNMTGNNRDVWHVFSDDPVMQRKFESAGAIIIETMKDGIGKKYTLRADQIMLRTGKRQLSDERKAQLATQLRAGLKSPTVQGEKQANMASEAYA